jgi:hypothetical protein
MRELGAELREGTVTRIHVAVPLLERLVSLYRAAGRDADALAIPLTALSFASYHVDSRLADRYGLETIETLESMIHCEPKCFETIARHLAEATETEQPNARQHDDSEE